MRRSLLLLLLCSIDHNAGIQTPTRMLDIANFLEERKAWQSMCLYTFDDPAINNGSTVENQVPNGVCPFDALQPDNELVVTLNSKHSYWQLGVHLAADPNNDTKREQFSSISTVSARDFFTMAAVQNDSVNTSGVTFEIVIRRRAKSNHSMTLFSIANEYDNCVDPGFRLDVNEHQVLVFVYFLPVLEEGGEAGVEACYEQQLFSVDNSVACQLPPLLEPLERTPPVQITVTLDPSSERGLWKTDFYMSYTDIDTMERVDCTVHDEHHPPNTQLLNKLIKGRYRLYLGNSPRNVISPRQRKRLASAREFQVLGSMNHLNATERLRELLKQKLMNIRGPRLPKAMRIFGDNSLSLHILGITFPPLNEDTPLAYLRSKLADFKEKYSDQIIDYLVNLVQQKVRNPVVTQRSQESSGQSSSGSGEFSRATLFQGADSATFDLFHFAIYRRVVSEDLVNSISRQQLLPSRQFPSHQQIVRIPEDSLVLLNLTMLHGVFNDVRLELRSLPEFGQLLLFPNKTIVTPNNKDAFRRLPLEYQRSIFFQPELDQNNENLPLPNPVAFSRRLKPYVTVRFGISDSLAGRSVNKTTEAEINIFVDAVNDAPRPQHFELEIGVEVGVPVTLDLKGDDIDGAPSETVSKVKSTDSSDLLSSFTFTNETTGTASIQLLKIVRMPQFGELFDCSSSCGSVANQEMQLSESTRVYQNSTNIVNATHSTNLMYIYHGWSQHNHAMNASARVVVDEFWYKLSDGDPDVFSDIAVVKFILVRKMDKAVRSKVLAVVRLEEDSLHLLNLGALDPLAAFFNAKTRFKVTALPQNGTLYQYNDHENGSVSATNLSLELVRERFAFANTNVTDFYGRVLFVPKPDSFNTNLQGRVSEVDYFEYQVLDGTPPTNDSLVVYDKSPAASFASGLETRRIELEIVNVPDTLIVLPPYKFTANLSSGDTVPTPVTFEDPDSTNSNDKYQVNLEAEDGTSEFKLGFAITDDDIMNGCPYERPCTLIRSTNGTRLNVTSSSGRYELQFLITTQLYDFSHIQVTGTKTALNTALSALTFRDLSGFPFETSHTTKFTLWVKRVGFGNRNGTDTLQAEVAFTVNFPAKTQSDPNSGENLVSALNSQLEQYISTLLVMIAGWLVLSNASCLSIGFCCCCCSKARKKRRQKFELQQQLFRAQVAQNDHEYSALLMSLADSLLEPNLLVSRCVLASCFAPRRSRQQSEILMQAFVLRSLLPLLESERQGTRFVFQLMAIEYSEGISTMKGAASHFQHQEFLTQYSTASNTLAYFCRIVAAKWISMLLVPGDDTNHLYLGNTASELEKLLDRLAAQVEALPAEIVILCRACIKLCRRDEEEGNQEIDLDAVHLVFFNHLLGPALLFPLESVLGFTPSIQQRNTLQGMAYGIVEFADQWSSYNFTKTDDFRSRSSSTDNLLGTFSAETQSTGLCRYKYEAVLISISQSSTIASAYDPNESKAEVDCDLMGMCLMNIHSLLDSYFPEFKRKMLQTQTSTNVEQIENAITRVYHLLKALDWPLVSIHELVEYARPELVNDPLLWNGLSFQEWHDRVHNHTPTSNRHTGSNRPQPLLMDQFDDCVLEQDNGSPHDVDWLST